MSAPYNLRGPLFSIEVIDGCTLLATDGAYCIPHNTATPTRDQENHVVTDAPHSNYNEDGTYTTAAALSLPAGTPALVLCSDKNWRLALRDTGDWPGEDDGKWRFADGKTRRVKGSSAAPVAMFDPNNPEVVSGIGHLLYSQGSASTVDVLVEKLIFSLVPKVPVTLPEPSLIGSVAKDADDVLWTRITPSGGTGTWISSAGGHRASWKNVRAVEVLPSGYHPEAGVNSEAAATA